MNEREIKQLLDKITPGEWTAETRYEETGSIDQLIYGDHGDICSLNELARPQSYLKSMKADAEFISKAPEIIKFLLKRIEELDAELIMESGP